MVEESQDRNEGLLVTETNKFCIGREEMAVQNTHPLMTRSKSGAIKNNLPFAGAVFEVSEPATVQQALKSVEWRKVIVRSLKLLVITTHGSKFPVKVISLCSANGCIKLS